MHSVFLILLYLLLFICGVNCMDKCELHVCMFICTVECKYRKINKEKVVTSTQNIRSHISYLSSVRAYVDTLFMFISLPAFHV